MLIFRILRYAPLIISIALFIGCLPLRAFWLRGGGSSYTGLEALLAGIVVLPSSPANLTWLANPVLFSAWILLALEESLPAALASLAALAIAASFLLASNVVTNEAGIPFPIAEYSSGYWMWLSSMVATVLSCMISIVWPPKTR